MKKSVTILIAFFAFTLGSNAQKTKNNKPSTAAEMQAMMKEAQKQMQKLDPATKKMMDSLGMKIPSISDEQVNSMGRITDKQIATAYEDSKRIVPKKNLPKIASISKQVLTNTNLAAYIETCNEFVEKKMPTDRKVKAEKLLIYLKNKNVTNDQIAGVANGFWITGYNAEMALYFFGIACKNNTNDVQLLSNYAAALTVCGGSQLAIPILNKLNNEFSKNSTILNNLGQAWFALGEIEKADKYLDSCINVFANHPQANATKAAILESKGKKAEAVEAMQKSILQTYSQEKSAKLSKLGQKSSSRKLSWNFAKKVDGLGLGNFKQPKLPMSLAESLELEPEWEMFKKDLNDAIAKLSAREKEIAEQSKTKYAETMKIMLTPGILYLSEKASKELEKTSDEFERKGAKLLKELNDVFINEVLVWEKEAKKRIDESHKKEFEQTGEGMANESFCNERTKIIDEYLQKANSRLEPLIANYLTEVKLYVNDMKYYGLYVTATDTQEESIQIVAKRYWLSALSRTGMFHLHGGCFDNEKKKGKRKPLAKFEDYNCESKTEFNVPYIGKSYFNCRGSGFELDAKIPFTGVEMPFKLKYDGTDVYTGKSTVYVSKDFSVDKDFSKGPLSVGTNTKIEASLFIELDGKGVSDVGLITKSSIEATASVKGLEINEDAIDVINKQHITMQEKSKSFEIGNNNTKISINSGISNTTKTFLD